jgi:GDP-4-dehydro-6-deoxy-D-mannose reductase
MKALIIGGSGFVGNYLAAHLTQDLGWETTVTKLPQEQVTCPGCQVCDLDILDKEAIQSLLTRFKPDGIFHLAAQSSVALSWKNPQLTAEINIRGCLNLLDAIRGIEDYTPKVLLIGSSEEYGALPKNTSLVTEETPVHPGNPYAITKLTQNLFGSLYAKAYGMSIVMVRAFNHVGPGQLPQFVVADFCKQVAEIAAGLREPVMHVGNLSAARDFTDVRDVVRAYGLLMQHGKAGETYNVGSGKAVVIRSLLEEIIAQSGVEITVETDPAKLRPVEIPEIRADITKLQQDTGWQPQIPLKQTIAETIADWREKI